METIQLFEISDNLERAIREFNASFHAILNIECPATRQVEEDNLALCAETIKAELDLESFSSVGRGELYGIKDGENVRVTFPIVAD